MRFKVPTEIEGCEHSSVVKLPLQGLAHTHCTKYALLYTTICDTALCLFAISSGSMCLKPEIEAA